MFPYSIGLALLHKASTAESIGCEHEVRMKRLIAGGILAMRAVSGVLIGALSRTSRYARNRIWLSWSLAGLIGAAVCISCTDLWGYLMHYAVMLLLPLPVLLAGWLAIGAEQARQIQRPMRACRRQ